MSVAAARRVVCRLAPDRPPTDAELVLALACSPPLCGAQRVPCAEREAAFGALVERYGPMVFGVCRRVLADTHDAEDAFQAVFLVLVRKANSIRPPGAVGGWLYGVAVRTARKAKTAAARRRRREMAATVSAKTERTANPDREVGSELQRAELRAVIDAELAALPEPQRAAVVLCDLHGKTRAEAAAELNRPEGTVAAWLARGRKALAARLARRGVALPAAGLVAVATPAVVSAELSSTACAAVLGRGASPTALALAESVMRNLSFGTTKLVAAVVALGALLVAVATAGAWYSGNDPKPDAPPVPLAAAAPADEPKPKPDMTGFVEHKGYVYSASYSPDGKRFLSVGGGTATVWDSETRRRLFSSGAEFAAFSDDGKNVFAVIEDKFHTLDAVTGKIVKEAERNRPKPLRPGRWAAFDATGAGRVEFDGVSHTLTASPAKGKAAKLAHQYESGDITGDLDLVYGRGGAFSPDGKRFAGIHKKLKDGTGEQGVLSIWDPLSGERSGTIHRANHPIHAFAWSPDGTEIAVAYSDCVRLYFANEKALAGVEKGHDDKGPFKRMQSIDVSGATAVAWSKDRKVLAIAVQESAGASIENGKGATSTEVVALPVAVVLFDLTTGKELRRIEGFPDNLPIVSLAVRPDGKQLVTAAGFYPDDGPASNVPQPAKNAPGLRVVPLGGAKPEPAAWTESKVLDLTGWLGGSVAYSADGKTLFFGGTGGHVRAYETATMKQFWEAETGEHFAAIAVSADGATVAATVKDGVRFLDAPTGKTGDLLEEKGNAPHAVGFFPDAPVLDPTTGQLLATKHKVLFGTGSGYTAKLWMEKSRLERGEPSTISASTVGAGKKPADEYAIPLAVSPDGKWAVTRGPIDRDTGKNVLWAWAAGGAAETRSLDGHKAVVVSAAWSKDGKLIVTGDADGEVIAWDAATFKEKSRTKLGGRVAGLALTADGKLVAAAVVQPQERRGGPGTYTEDVFVWATDAPPAKPEPISSHAVGGPFSGVASVAFSPDGKALASGFANFVHLARGGELVGRVRVFTPAPPAAKPTPTRSIYGVRFSPDGTRYLAVRDTTVEVYDTATGRLLFEVEAEGAGFVAGNGLIAMGSKAVAVHDARGKLTATHPRPKTKEKWYNVAFSPDGKRFAAHFDQHVRVFDTATGFEPFRLDGQVEMDGLSKGGEVGPWVVFSADGKKLLAARVMLTEGGAAGAAIWDAASGKRLLAFPIDPKAQLNRVAFSPNDTEVAVATMEQVEVRTLGDAKKNPVRHIVGAWTIDSIAYSADGKLLAVGTREASGADGDLKARGRSWVVRVFDAATGAERKRLDGVAGKVDLAALELAFAPDGKKLLVGINSPGNMVDGEVKLFDLNEPEQPKPAPGRQWTDAAVLTDHGALVSGVAVSPDGKSFAAATDGNVTCWDAATRKPLWVTKTDGKALALEYSPNGKHIAFATEKVTEAVDATTGKPDPKAPLMDIGGKLPGGHAIAYRPTGFRIAVSDGKETLIRSTPPRGDARIGGAPEKEKGTLPAGVAWAPDGKRFAHLRHEKYGGGWPVVVWDAEEAINPQMTLLRGHAEMTTAVAWSKDGKVIASGDEGGIVILWDAATGKELWRRAFTGRDNTIGRVNALALSPADNTVAVAVSLGSGKGPERVVLLNGKDGKDVEHLMRSSHAYTSVAWEKDGKYLVTGSGALPGQVVKQTDAPVGEVVVWERKP